MTFKNNSGADKSFDKNYNNDRSHWTSNWKIEIVPEDKSRLTRFMNEELSFYNSLVETFNTRLRGQPETIGLLIGDWEKIFCICAEIRFRASQLRNANETFVLPEQLLPYKNLLLGSDSKGRILNEKYIVLLDPASAAGNIHPLTRKNLALEVLYFYREQAKHALQEIKISGMDGTSYKNSFINLEKLDNTRKRHLQIPKEALRYKYNIAKKILQIWTPYNTQPLEISGFSNIDEKPWNLMIIHQTPGGVATTNTPWSIELKNVPNQYLIKLVEVKNPYAGSSNYRFAKATSGGRV